MTGADDPPVRGPLDPIAIYALILDAAIRARDLRAIVDATPAPVASDDVLDEIARNAAQALYGVLVGMGVVDD